MLRLPPYHSPLSGAYAPFIVTLCQALLCWLCLALPAAALTAPSATERLDAIEAIVLDRASEDTALLDAYRELGDRQAAAEDCLREVNEALATVGDKLDKLGPAAADESREIVKTRKSLVAEQAGLEQRHDDCEVQRQRSLALMEQITQRQDQALAQRLLQRGESFPSLLLQYGEHPRQWLDDTRVFLTAHTGIDEIGALQALAILAAIAVGLLAGLQLRGLLRRGAGHMEMHDSFSSRFAHGAMSCFAHSAPLLFASSAGALALHIETGSLRPLPLISLIFYGLPIYVLLSTLLQLFIAPRQPAQPLFDLPQQVARALVRRLRILLLLCFAGYLLYAALQAQALPAPAVALARAVFIVAFVLNVLWALWLMEGIPQLARNLWLRRALAILLLATVATEWLGYRNLSIYVLRGVLGTLLALGLYEIARRLFNELFNGLRTGRHRWQRGLRGLLGVQDEAVMPGLNWLRLVTTLGLWIGLAYLLLRLWGLSDIGIEQAQNTLTMGFNLGSLHIVPAKLLLALLVLALLLTASNWFRGRLEHQWLADSHMDRGAREALVTISGYVGIAIAILFALGIAGMEFSNLAIVAGALSVGIGFGLQNIVNNFISGLILLFERPIKTGDWVVVGGTEGYVKKISIRTTHIQTFDQSDVIVPNSDLIQGQVINWMLEDAMGRVRVPVGVAYGSDTAKVRELLLQVAHAHPLVVTDGRASEPRVLFLAFGDSSLDFELRCFIENVDKRLQVLSDLNFAIDAAFRANDVEIPFPQRDLHIKNWPGAPDAAT